MVDLMVMLPGTGDLGVEFYARPTAVAKAFLLGYESWRFLHGKIDDGCV